MSRISALPRLLAFALFVTAASHASAQSAVPGVVSADKPVSAPAVTSSSVTLIRGRVLSAITSEPLDGAVIAVRPDIPVSSPIQQARSNEKGEFEIPVTAGRYTVRATVPGFIQGGYGARSIRSLGRTVEIAAGQIVQGIDIRLQPSGAISGRILDSTGAPIAGMSVHAMTTQYLIAGRKLELPIGTVRVTGTDGRYDLKDLADGSYVIAAFTDRTWPGEDTADEFTYGRTYFPEGDRASAATIDLRPGELRTGVDIRLSQQRAARISGHLLRPDGSPFEASRVRLRLDFPGLPDGVVISTGKVAETVSLADGSFEFTAIPPGNYQIIASGEVNTESDSMTVAVNGRDVSGLVLRPTIGSTLRGRLVTDDGRLPGFQIVPRVFADAVSGSNTVGAVANDGTFALASLGGSYLFRIQGLADGWILKTVKLNGIDVTDRAAEIPSTNGSDAGEVEIVITRKSATLTGAVVDREGRPDPSRAIVLFADDSKLWLHESRFVRATPTDDRGQFSFRGLPPGNYRIVAVESVEAGQWLDPDYLAGLRSAASRLTLVEDGTAAVTLKVP